RSAGTLPLVAPRGSRTAFVSLLTLDHTLRALLPVAPWPLHHRRRIVRERGLRLLGMRRQHHPGFGPIAPFDRADRADQLLQRGGVHLFHLEKEGMLPGDVVTLEHTVERGDIFFELADQLGVTDGHADEGGYIVAQTPGIEDGVVAGDNAV